LTADELGHYTTVLDSSELTAVSAAADDEIVKTMSTASHHDCRD